MHAHQDSTGDVECYCVPSVDNGWVFQGIYPEQQRTVKVDDLIVWGSTQAEMVENLEQVFGRLKRRGLYVAAHECRFFALAIKWCGSMFLGKV